MIKFTYPDDTCCYRAIHTVHAVFRSDNGKLIARAEKADGTEMYEFEIKAFELLQAGITFD